jgi:predicted NBD/HSP70 family sugar kinase
MKEVVFMAIRSFGSRPPLGAEVGGPVLATVLEAVIRKQPISRSELAAETSLPPSTVTKAVTPLLGHGYLKEEPPRVAERGRPVIPLHTGDDYRLLGINILDVDLDAEPEWRELPDAMHVGREGQKSPPGTRLVGVVTRLDGTVDGPAEEDSFRISSELDPSARAAVVAEKVKGLIDRLGERIPYEHVAGLGVTVGGHVENGSIISSCHDVIWGVKDPVPLREHLKKLLPDLDVVVENDADALATYIRLFRGGLELQPLSGTSPASVPDTFVAVVMTDGGIGAGLYLHGKRYVSNGIAGEIGHFRINRDEQAPQCRWCRKRGCVESYATPRALRLRLGKHIQEHGIDSDLKALCNDFAAAANSTHPDVKRVFGCGGEMLGVALSFAINLLGPEAIVIFAPRPLSNEAEGSAGRRYWDELRVAVRENSFSKGADTPILYSPLPPIGEFLAYLSAVAALDALVTNMRAGRVWLCSRSMSSRVSAM